MGSWITRLEFPSKRSSKVSQRIFTPLAADIRIVISDREAVLSRCIDLVGSDDENDEEPEIDPMLGQSGPGTGK